LSTILSVLFMMVVYRMLPSLENANIPPRLALYDAGQSRLVTELENNLEFDVISLDSHADMERYVGDKDIVMLGLTLPDQFDQRLASDEPIDLEGYVVHWASKEAAAEVQTFFEERLMEIAGRPVHINIAGNTVFTQKNSRGYAMLAALSVVFAITMVSTSLVPHIMLEERHTKTIDALLVSPASPSQVVLGKAVTGLFYCLTAAAVTFVLNLTLVNQWGLAVLAAVLGSLFAVALGLLLGSTIANRGQLTLWAWVLLAPLLGAPLLTVLVDVLPASLITALGWVPTVALSRLLRLSFSDSAPLAQVGPEVALMVGWIVPTLIAVVWLVRRSDR
jgi:hypothetical protein